MSKVKVKIQIAILKRKTIQARANHQLPIELSSRILDLNENSDVEYVKHLCFLTEHYIRIKGYYKRYKLADDEASADIRKGLIDKGFIQND